MTHQWFTFNMITGLNLLNQRYCPACTNLMRSLLQHNPSSHDKCGLQAELSCFDLKPGDVCLINVQSKTDTHWTSQLNKLGNCSPDSQACKPCFQWVFKKKKKFHSFPAISQETLSSDSCIPILRGCRPYWDINPIFSIHLFYLNSCVLFQLLFTPTTGYRFTFLSNASLYIIPLSVYTTKTCNRLNCFLKMCKKKCTMQSPYPDSKQN